MQVTLPIRAPRRGDISSEESAYSEASVDVCKRMV